ncbi:MAG: hypothetical protein NXI04_28220 [Planctomycetaceae bacterium]|nr:hypothetical protein [Planctomycetaceae bacterium]
MSRLICLWVLAVGAGTVSAQQASSAAAEATPAAVRAASWEQHQRMRLQSPFADLAWHQMGPTFCGGRIEAIAPHPHRPATMYVGVGSGGLWKTVNNGMTWQPVFDQQATIAIGDVAVAASRPETVWVGTGEVLLARSSLPGMGVYRSVDGGASWKNMGLQDSQHIGRILIHPTDHNTVYVAAIGHQNSPNQQRGVFRTTDGGDNWEQVLYANDGAAAIDLVLDPKDPLTLYASLWQREASTADVKSASGVYRTNDGGDTWSLLAGGLPSGEGVDRIGIHVAPSNSQVVYALADEGDRDGFYRSVDAGQTWHLMNDSLQARWDWCEIRVSPDNADEVYSIGQNSFVSRDGGRTFEKIAGTIIHLLPHGADVIHLDTHAMWINPHDADHVIFGTDGGVFVTHDRCQTWLHLNNMPVAECYAVTHDRRDPWNVYVGTQDNAALFGPHTHRPAAGQPDEWEHVYLDRWGGGDSYFTYRDPTDDDVVYYEHQYGEMRRKNMKSGQTIDIQPAIAGEQLRFAWMTPFFPSAHNGRTLYAAANRVFKSTDRGENWMPISPDLVGDDAVRNLRYRAVTTLSESRRRAGLIFAGTDNGELYVTADDGKTWKAIHAELPRRSYSRVLASGHDEERVFATQSGAGLDDYTSRVFRSDDAGQNWTDISGGLPAECVNVIVEDPQVSDLLYVGTDQGVYASLNGGESWISLCADLPAAAVADLLVHAESGQLVIATHGRSCYVTNARPIQQAAKHATQP